MKIDFEGRLWPFEIDEIDVEQGEKIAEHTGGLSIAGWYKSLLDVDSPAWVKSMQCLYWLIHEQNREPVPIDSRKFFPLKLFAAFGAAREAEQPAEAAEPDPTRPAGEPAAGSPDPSLAESPAG